MKTLCLIVLFCCAFSIAHGIKCYQCSGDVCMNIKNQTSEECNAEEKWCITKFDSKEITRGCAKLDTECKSPSCYSCDKDECNKHIVCKKCESSDNKKCSINPTDIHSELCDAGIKCVTQINDQKHTERKCAPSKEFKCVDDKTCKTCEENECNSEVFPENRRICYQCDNCNDIEYVKPLPCTLYEPNDKCYSYGQSDKDMTRGCTSNPIKACTEEATKDKCLQCEGNECNKVGFMVEPNLKCVQCDVADAKCQSGYKSEDAKTCQKSFEYWKLEQCYVETSTDGKTTRGCVLDREENEKDCIQEKGCTTCTKNGCNNAEIKEQPTCIRCRSSVAGEESCKNKPDGIKGKECDKSISSAADKGCFTDKLDDDVVVRGCIVDYDANAVKNCKDKNYKKCDFCDDANDCNNKEAPNSAPALGLSTVFLSVSVLLIYFH